MKCVIKNGVLVCEIDSGPHAAGTGDGVLFHQREDAESFLRRFCGSGRNMRLLRDVVHRQASGASGMDDAEVLRQAAILLQTNHISVDIPLRDTGRWDLGHPRASTSRAGSDGSRPLSQPIEPVQREAKKAVDPNVLAQAAAFKRAAASGNPACEP